MITFFIFLPFQKFMIDVLCQHRPSTYACATGVDIHTETARKTKIRRRVMNFLIFLSFRLIELFYGLFAYSFSPGKRRFVTPISDFLGFSHKKVLLNRLAGRFERQKEGFLCAGRGFYEKNRQTVTNHGQSGLLYTAY
jgi:hypothetical protein